MGFRQAFREAFGISQPAGIVPLARLGAGTGVASPWATAELDKFVWADILGTDSAVPVTRAEAMTLPAVANGRARILEKLAGTALRVVDTTGPVAKQPNWLTRTDTGINPWQRLAALYDDWIFYGDALWVLNRGADNAILDALHLPRDRWEITPEGLIMVARVQGGPKTSVEDHEVLYLRGPFDGLLNVAASTIRGAKDLERTWIGKARNPTPAIVLREKEDNGMDLEEAAPYVAAVAKARRDPDGAVMFVPYMMDVSFEGTSEPAMLIEARNAVKIDIASFLNLPAEAVEAAQPKASLNYETSTNTDTEVGQRMAFWTQPLEARLSMDDVVPAGSRIRFDFSQNQDKPGGDTGAFSED